MTERQFFGAIVRAMGLYWFLYGLTYLCSALSPPKDYQALPYLLIGMGQMIVATFLLLKADGVVQTCYSRTDAEGYPEP
jgi:hypothetical protein